MPDTGKLVRTSMALRAEAPGSWDQFVFALGEYAAAVTADMVRCPPEMLQRAQGMAMQATELAAITRDAAKLYEKMMGPR